MRDQELMLTPPGMPPAEVEEEFMMLMSMALDGLLDADEQARLDEVTARYPALAAEWQAWQMLDAQMTAVPHIAPPVDFMATFETRLAQQQRRRHLWWGVGFGALVALLAAGMLLGVAAFGAFVLVSQPGWLSELVHGAALGSAVVAQWLRVLQNTLISVAASEQARTFGLIYIVTAVAMLAGWVLLLRRTTRPAATTQAA